MGCSGVLWDVPGVFRGCSGLFRAVPGVFRGVPGVFRILQTPLAFSLPHSSPFNRTSSKSIFAAAKDSRHRSARARAGKYYSL